LWTLSVSGHFNTYEFKDGRPSQNLVNLYNYIELMLTKQAINAVYAEQHLYTKIWRNIIAAKLIGTVPAESILQSIADVMGGYKLNDQIIQKNATYNETISTATYTQRSVILDEKSCTLVYTRK
jgi:hypothetical protein